MWNLDSGTESDRTSRRELGRSSKNCRLYFTLQMPSQSSGCEDKQPSKRVIYHCIILKRNIPNARAQHKCIPSFPATFLLHSFTCLYLEKKNEEVRKNQNRLWGLSWSLWAWIHGNICWPASTENLCQAYVCMKQRQHTIGRQLREITL